MYVISQIFCFRQLVESGFSMSVSASPPGFDGYCTSKEQLHEAGYDAFITGLCFISMSNFLGNLSSLYSVPVVVSFHYSVTQHFLCLHNNWPVCTVKRGPIKSSIVANKSVRYLTDRSQVFKPFQGMEWEFTLSQEEGSGQLNVLNPSVNVCIQSKMFFYQVQCHTLNNHPWRKPSCW